MRSLCIFMRMTSSKQRNVTMIVASKSLSSFIHFCLLCFVNRVCVEDFFCNFCLLSYSQVFLQNLSSFT